MSGYCETKTCIQHKNKMYLFTEYCRSCGTLTIPINCTQCTHEIYKSDKFCGFCGRPIDTCKETNE